jgi:signal transduction histidine kinase
MVDQRPNHEELATQAPVVPRIASLPLLALLIWGVTSEVHLGLGGRHLVALCLLVLGAVAWVAWTGLRSRRQAPLAQAACLAVMAITGGALVCYAPLGLVFVAVAALGSSMAWPLRYGAAISATGLLSIFVTVTATSHSYDVLENGAAAVAVGLMLGGTRRRAVESAEQSAELQIARQSSEIEAARAELLTDRNHLAREIHDVLAHTLSALSLQLEAFDTVVESDPNASAEVRQQLQRTKELVHEGLDEARGAVRALRENAAPLDQQLFRLSAEHDAKFTINGEVRALSPQGSLSLYRIAQEALTNAMKHAPGAPVSIEVDYETDAVLLKVENGPPTKPPTELGKSGGGYGLQGITERITLLGGRLEAAPHEGGWRLEAELPTAE